VAGSPDRYADALKSVDQALKLKSDYLDAMLLKADILMLSEDYDAAALASFDIEDPATLAAAGEQIEEAPEQLSAPQLGNPSASVESEGEARNSPMV